MIIDSLDHASHYFSLSSRFEIALRYLIDGAWKDLPLGVHQIDGDDVHVQVQAYDSIPVANLKWEAHHKFCDIQYVVEGIEEMGYGTLANFTTDIPYDEEKEVYFLKGQGQFITVPAGMFTIFMPQDVHIPRVAIDDQPSPVRKLVFKVRV